MKEIVKKFVKVLIIYVVITMTIFSTISYGYTPEEVGDAIAGYAAHVITDYRNKVRYSQNGRANNPIWSESYDWESSSEYFFDCTSYSTGCIHAVTGLLSSPLWTGAMLPSQVGNYTTDFDVIDYDKSKLLPGDVVFHDDGEAHGVVYLGKEYSAWGTSGEIGNNGSTFRSISYFDNNYEFYIYGYY